MRRLVLLLLRGTGDTDVSPDVTATLPAGVTATPLALEAQDEVIEGGDASRAPIYPISLQVSAGDGTAPRVWVVQRRAVRASEWNFDPNPDTASFLNGMAVRPVVGIPWSEDNAAWFEQIVAGAAFRVQMNTGVVLTFTFEDKRGVRRSDTDIFRQVTPDGLTPFALLPGQAADITLVWRSNSEPYGSLGVGAYRYAFQFDTP